MTPDSLRRLRYTDSGFADWRIFRSPVFWHGFPLFNSLFRIACGGLILLLLSSCGSPPSAQTKKKKVRAQPPHAASAPALPTEDSTDRNTETSEPAPESSSTRFRPDDRRPAHDDAALEQAGIHRYQSKYLKLYTDLDSEIAKKLPPIADQLYAALVDYFGPLPPDRLGTEFQMTGYLMRDETLFRDAGLLENVPLILHGRHLANRFWMRSQESEYFTRHLLLHECTHCFMTFVPGYAAPLWYSEGMAEHFAAHRVNPEGTAEFRILLASDEEVPGWGRIPSIRRDIAAGNGLTIAGVEQLADPDYFQPQAYAWAWAFCDFLDAHPRYQTSFRSLSQHLRDNQFDGHFRKLLSSPRIRSDWLLFAQSVQYGFDLARAMQESPARERVDESGVHVVTVSADRGWQDSGVLLEEGVRYEVTAEGQFTLADHPKPWLSEPQGITIEYHDGQPLGKLVALIEPKFDDSLPRFTAWKLIPLGKQHVFSAPYSGRLLLRLNDHWNSLDDNSGEVEVHIRRAP